MKYLVLGAGGMAGHLISIYLKEQGENVIGLARKKLNYIDTKVLDITKFEELEKYIINEKFDTIINCIGILNKNAEDNISLAILINSYLPHFLGRITKYMNTKIIHMSTDCVFSGERGNYSEEDATDAKTIYGKSKALGEINDNKNLTFRNSIVGPDMNCEGIGLFNWFMKQTGNIQGYDKSIWSGVTTITLAKAIHKASYQNLTGVYNLVNNEIITKFELLQLFKKYSNTKVIITKTEGMMHDKSLVNSRKDFDFIVPSYDKMVEDMFEWNQKHLDFYSHYKKEH